MIPEEKRHRALGKLALAFVLLIIAEGVFSDLGWGSTSFSCGLLAIFCCLLLLVGAGEDAA